MDWGLSMKITLPDEALAALKADGAKLKAPFKPLDPRIIYACRRTVARAVFGPVMRHLFKEQLLTFVSFDAIKSPWAADYFQKMGKARHGIT